MAPKLAKFEYLIHTEDYNDACRTLDPLDFDYLFLWGHYALLVELREQLVGHLTHPRLRADNLGNAHYLLGKIEQASKLYEEALAIARETGNRRGEGVRLGNLGDVYRALGQVERAVKLYEEALDIARETGHRREEGHDLGHLGLAYRALGQVERAVKLYEEALTIAREIGHRRVESHLLLELGKTLLATGELSKARRRCAEACDLDIPETSHQAALLLGIVFLRQGDPAARETFADAAARCQAMLDKTAGLYKARYALAAALVERGLRPALGRGRRAGRAARSGTGGVPEGAGELRRAGRRPRRAP